MWLKLADKRLLKLMNLKANRGHTRPLCSPVKEWLRKRARQILKLHRAIFISLFGHLNPFKPII